MKKNKLMKCETQGRWLAALRRQAGFSQPHLAERMSALLGRPFNHSNFGKWETGSHMQNVDVFPALATALGITLEELLKVRHTARGYIALPDDELPPRRF